MRASEWQYLCAVHDPPKSCAAIDYCCHTLDWAATTLTSSKMFPSRLGLGSGSGMPPNNDKVLQQQMKEIKNIFRRVYRIYAHAWFQHREMFWRVEAKTGLYVLFNIVCHEYGIIEPDNYTIPAEAEGLEPEPELNLDDTVQAPQVLKRDQDASPSSPKKMEDAFGLGDTTKRHRHTKSDFTRDPSAVIKEEVEEEEEQDDSELLPKLQQQPEPIVTDKPPAIARQGTAIKDPTDTEQEASEEVDVEDESETPIENHTQLGQVQEEPEVGILRSDTIKPEKFEADEGAEAETEVEGDQTVVDTSPESTPDSTPDSSTTSEEGTEEAPIDEVVQEFLGTEEELQTGQPAAAAEEAAKTVGD